MAGVFIDVKVDAAVAKDAALAKKLVEVCPVNIFAQEKDGGAAHRRGEPRRVHALRPVHPGRAARGDP